MTEPVNLYELLMGEVGEVPAPRSFEETTAAAFRAQDLADKESRQRAEKLAAERPAGPVDAGDVAAFLGRTRTHADVIADYAALSDQADAWQAHQAERAAKRAEREREEATQRRIAELEAEAAEASTRAERQARNFSQAVDGWAAERRRSEQGASFRGERQYVRSGGEILGIR